MIGDFARAAKLAQAAGYDGVEIMGSEGYLINQFLSQRVNRRDDGWGGSIDGRMRFAVEIVRAVRAACGPAFIVMFRLSLLDLVEGGNTMDETIAVAQALEHAGITLLNTGIGWHEARIPTIATSVPRAAFRAATGRVKRALTVPVVASNRINTPEVGEAIIGDGDADLVSMARPFLADAEFVAKAAAGRAERSTPASPATRPASTTPLPTSRRPAWSTRAPSAKPSWSTAGRPRRSRSPWSAPAWRGSPARPSPRSAAIA